MKRVTLMKRVIMLLPLPLALALRLVASSHPDWVEMYYANGIYPMLAAPISRLFRVVSIPFIEILVVIFVIFCVYLLFRKKFLTFVSLVLLVPAIFIGGWSLNYFRLPLEQTLTINVAPAPVSALTDLCEKLMRDANARYTKPEGDLLASANDALNNAARLYPIPTGQFGAPKFALTSPLMSRFLIEGITSPFTLEALVNQGVPTATIPFVACHESAHVRGFAREEDANLVAYLACESSDNPYYRYSGALNALQYAMQALHSADSNSYTIILQMASEQVMQDLIDHDAYWAPYRQTKAAEAGARVNEAYLQTMGGGDQSTQSYGRLVDLLLGLYEKGRI